MKKWFCLFALLLGWGGTLCAQDALPAEAPKVTVVYFGSPYCLHCRHMEKEFLPGFLERHAGKIELVRVDVTKNNLVFLQALERYQVEAGGTPAMAIGEDWVMGYPQDIGTRADLAVEKALINREKLLIPVPSHIAPNAQTSQTLAEKQLPLSAANRKAPTPAPAPAVKPETAAAPNAQKPGLPAQQQVAAQGSAPKTSQQPVENIQGTPAAEPSADGNVTHESVFNRLSFFMIAGAGLVDGINPCAFAVIVFFISFLTVYKYTRREIITVGTAYCAAVFVAYVLLGLGAFQFLYAMQGFYYVMWGLKAATVGLCVVFLALSLYDWWHYVRTKDTAGLVLQLPTKYKTFIHKVMHAFLKDRSKSVWRLGLAATAVGFVVSLVEAVCTGQVYLPTIVVVLKESGNHFWRAAQYLLIYNLMFVAPLLVVFILALVGYESKTFGGRLKKHLGLAKLLLCAVFVGLLILLIKTW